MNTQKVFSRVIGMVASWATCLTIMVVMGTTSPLTAQPPNDNFANAEVLVTTAVGTTVGATHESGEIGCSAPGCRSIWYQWVPPASGIYWIGKREQEEGASSEVTVYTGNDLASLVLYLGPINVCDSCDHTPFPDGMEGDPGYYDAGVTYYLALTTYDQTAVQVGVFPVPTNDAFANATVLTTTANGTTIGCLGFEPDEPAHWAYSGGGYLNRYSIWFEWTAPSTGCFAINTCGSDFDTVLAVYTGDTLASLQVVGRDDQGSSSCPINVDASEVVVSAIAGSKYRVAASGSATDVGNVTVNVVPCTSPSNDNFADAQLFTTSATGDSTFATHEAGEPWHRNLNGGGEYDTGSVWYQWVAPESRTYIATTCGSDFATALAVYTGTSLDELDLVGNDDVETSASMCLAAADDVSEAVFDAASGTSYRMAVAGYFGSTGSVAIDVTPFSRPANDHFANAAVLVGSAAGSNVGATLEPGESGLNDPFNSNGERSVWYRWTAPRAGSFRIAASTSTGQQFIYVFTGSTLAGLTYVGAGSSSPSPGVNLTATAGTTYHIRLAGFRRASALHTVNIIAAAPTNGDANADAALNISDLTAINNAITGIVPPPLPGDGDIDNDGDVDAADAVLLRDHLANGAPLP